MKFAILINPKHFRNYNTSSEKILLAEFNILNRKYNFASNIEIKEICDINYLLFDAESITNIIEEISNLSFNLALFEIKNDLLKPIKKERNDFVNSNISSMLKYSGKTNEYFTELMLNIASNLIDKKDDINLLDPICGKGTTLFEGLVKGYNCYGIEIAPKVVDEIAVFLRKFLENERYKFNLKKEKFSGANKSFKAERYIFDITKNKENRDNKHFEVVSGNTIYADKIFKKDYFDIIIGDLPYGVKHSNITNEKQNSFTRSPKELLQNSLSVWKNLLNNDGIMILSWNTFLLKRNEFVSLLEEKGLKLVDIDSINNFEHRVDQAINRDLIVVKK